MSLWVAILLVFWLACSAGVVLMYRNATRP
jgi:hypothetical protein